MSFIKNQSGATAIEYGLIAALIAVAAITAISSLSNNKTSDEAAVTTLGPDE